MQIYRIIVAGFLLLVSSSVFANQVQLSDQQIGIIHKLVEVTQFDKQEAAGAMMSLFAYQETVSSVTAQQGLTTAERRVRIREAYQLLIAELRTSMRPNQIRKWLDFSLPRVAIYPGPVASYNIGNQDWLGGQWQNRAGLP